MTEPGQGSVRPTGAAVLAVAALAGAASGLTVKLLLDWRWGASPAPTGPWLLLAVLAGVVAWFAWTAHRRVQVRREIVPARLALFWLQLAKTSALGGAGILGGFLAYALASASHWATPLGHSRVLYSGLAALFAAALAVAGLALERACRVPPPAKDEDADGPS